MTNVPKRDLVGAVQTEPQTGQLKVAASLPEAVTLQRELQNFRIKFTKAGNDTYEHWREADHEDLVFAVATPLWLAQNTGIGVFVDKNVGALKCGQRCCLRVTSRHFPKKSAK